MRKRSDKGTDIAFTFGQGVHIRHGDVVVLTENKIVVVDIEPEDVAMIEVKENAKDEILNLGIRIGHTIGNLHRPIKLEENKIFFPIQADTEIDMLRNLLRPIADHVEIKKTSMVFEPEEEMKVHAH
jgi:urease accessory protein